MRPVTSSAGARPGEVDQAEVRLPSATRVLKPGGRRIPVHTDLHTGDPPRGLHYFIAPQTPPLDASSSDGPQTPL